MNLRLKTKVNGHFQDVMGQFTVELFEALKPPGVKMNVLTFTGSKTGDVVELEFISPIKSSWVSDITDHGLDDSQAYFVDEGRVLPFPLRHWKHKHIVQKIDEDSSYIIDDIHFSTGYKVLDPLLYLPLLISFYPRKKIYKRFFSKSKELG